MAYVYFELTAIDYFHAMNNYSISVFMFMFMFIFNVYLMIVRELYKSNTACYIWQNKYVKSNSSH